MLGIPDALLPTYLEEIASTLASAAWKLRHSTATRRRAGPRRLPDDRGRDDRGPPGVRRQQRPDRLRRSTTTPPTRRRPAATSGCSGSPPAASTPGCRWARASPRRSCTPASSTRRPRALEKRVRDLGLDPADYLLLPVHPWQWRNKLAITFAPDVARRDLVLLGEGPDALPRAAVDPHLLQRQPPRAALREDRAGDPEHGLHARALPGLHGRDPAINDWVADLVDADPTLRAAASRCCASAPRSARPATPSTGCRAAAVRRPTGR